MKINRRSFLKLVVFGGAAFVAGKFFGSIFNNKDKIISEKIFNNYRITETESQFKLIDKHEDEIIIIDKY